MVNADIVLDESLNPAFRSDALRLEILYQKGGAYMDIDMCMIQEITKIRK